MKLINNIDNFFYEKTKKDFLYFIIMIVGLIAFLIYYFIYPISLKYKEDNMKKYEDLSTKINELTTSINVLNAQIVLLERKLKQLNVNFSSLKKKKMFYSELVKLLDFAEFDQYKWGQLLDEMIKVVKSYDMKVVDVYNKIYDINNTENGKISKKMDVVIFLKGDYKSFISYMYNYENKKELIRVEEFNISSPYDFSIKFSVYGYTK